MFRFILLSLKIFVVLAIDEGRRWKRNAYYDVQERDDFLSGFDALQGVPVYDYDLVSKFNTFPKRGEEQFKMDSPLKNLFFTRMRNSFDTGLDETPVTVINEVEEIPPREIFSSPSEEAGQTLYPKFLPDVFFNEERLITNPDKELGDLPFTKTSDFDDVVRSTNIARDERIFPPKADPFHYDFNYDFADDTRFNGKNLHAFKSNSDLFHKRSARDVRSTSMKLNSCHSQHLERCGSNLIKKFESISTETIKCRLREEFLDCMVQQREQKCQPTKQNFTPEGINSLRSKVKNLLWSAHGCLLF